MGSMGKAASLSSLFQSDGVEAKFQVRSDRTHIDPDLEISLLPSCKIGLGRLWKMSAGL